MIKQKIAKCIDCDDSSEPQPVIAGRCQAHYWKYRQQVNDEKRGKKYVIPKRTEKRLAQEIEYAKKRKVWLPLHPRCEMKLAGCTIVATEVHHTQGRENDLLLLDEYWKSGCHNCHTKATEHSRQAIEDGISMRRNQPIERGIIIKQKSL